MKVAPLPSHESSRLAALRLLNILDSQPEERFDRLTRLAKRLFGVPIAQVTLIDEGRQWFKSGRGDGPAETSRDFSFCAHAILGEEILMVSNALEDERFFDNPLVTGDPNIRFYAGFPLKIGAHHLGTLCVIDDKPRCFGEDEMRLLTDLGELAQQELATLQLATTDHLTGISNRRGFESLARHALSVCRRMGQPATLLFFDLDRLKQINDEHGHGSGDRALTVFAQGLLAVFRESDVVGRMGGDEFAVLLAGTAKPDAGTGVERLRNWIHDHASPEQTGYGGIHFSVGQIECDLSEPHSIEGLLGRADAAMYRKKRSRAELSRSTP